MHLKTGKFSNATYKENVWCKKINILVIIIHKFRKSLNLKKKKSIIIRINIQNLIMIYDHMQQCYKSIKNKLIIKLKDTAIFEEETVFSGSLKHLKSRNY